MTDKQILMMWLSWYEKQQAQNRIYQSEPPPYDATREALKLA